jgi:alkanesulfonate monooxygenase SsuD/methylene tetrahydromethanopterin reductase-like flavin-dependent oxidoreductase (luciferase family)
MAIMPGSDGPNTDPAPADPAAAFRLAELADRSGLDFIGGQDHLDFLDAWTPLTPLPQSRRPGCSPSGSRRAGDT